MRRLALLVPLVVLAVACGGSKPTTSTTTTATRPPPDPAAAMRALAAAEPKLAGKTVKTLFEGSDWAVVESASPGKASAVPFRLVGNRWVADQTNRVKLTILGPQPGAPDAPARVQVAIQFAATQAFVETALWVDGTELQEKGGGSPTRGTIYGTTAHPLKPGEHVAVGYARTGSAATAVAWVFTVR